MKVLIAEDDPHILQGLNSILQSEGYQTCLAEDGEQALQYYYQQQPDFLCLDIMMPKLNGYDVCKKVRQDNEQIPIIFISAKAEEIDRVLGLELGADDFIAKPFGVKEVIARIRAVTRRYMLAQKQTNNSHFQMADLMIYPQELRAKRQQQNIELSLRDIKILQLLYQHKNAVVQRETLFNHCWNINYLPNSRTLDQHVSQLRKRIEANPGQPEIITTVHGMGYRYNDRLSC